MHGFLNFRTNLTIVYYKIFNWKGRLTHRRMISWEDSLFTSLGICSLLFLFCFLFFVFFSLLSSDRIRGHTVCGGTEAQLRFSTSTVVRNPSVQVAPRISSESTYIPFTFVDHFQHITWPRYQGCYFARIWCVCCIRYDGMNENKFRKKHLVLLIKRIGLFFLTVVFFFPPSSSPIGR